MTNEQLIQAVLRAVREADGNRERLLKLSFGCRFHDSLNNYGTVTAITDFVDEQLPYDIHFVMDDTLVETETAASEWFEDEMTIIGHPPQWSDVLVAIGEFSQLQGNGDLQIFSEGEGLATIGTVDLTLTPEAAMLADPQLTKLLAGVLWVGV